MGDEGGHKVLTFNLASPYTLFHLDPKKIEDARCLDIVFVGGSQLRMLLRCRNVMRL